MGKTTPENNTSTKNQFGTFTGVFTPSILTILGVIMFMRAPFVIGEAGVFGALLILVVAKTITVLTSFSISAISTNMNVRGGGAYYLISRVLGPAFGGSIGLALFFAIALSVPFYILGFTEALCISYPSLNEHFLQITITTAIIFFVVSYIGAGWALKVQLFILLSLIFSIVVFLGGALELFSFDTLRTNWQSEYTTMDANIKYSFWIVFAIYFPAVTGIGAGLNMSGDLKEPALSIPRGTLWAVLVGFAVYLLQTIICGGAFARADLINTPYDILKDNALFGLTFVVAGGVFSATLSSALGSYLGAPRVLQAVSRDPIMMFLKPFAKGSDKGDEPRRALIFTLFITIGVLVWAGNESGGASLNAVASIITMFFLYTYGMINLAAFIEAIGKNPSFRPKFKFFHWIVALLGAVGCIGVSFLINPLAATIAILILIALYWYIRAGHLSHAFGDARRGFVYSKLRNNLLWLNSTEEDSRNWRPTILILSNDSESREILLTYSDWLESGRGLVILTQVLIGKFAELAPRIPIAEKKIKELFKEKDICAFPMVAVSENLETGTEMILQTASIGSIKPNLVVLRWLSEEEDVGKFINQLQMAKTLGMGLVLINANELPTPAEKAKKRIDLWWRGQKNGDIMIILAWLLVQNDGWENTTIRVLRIVDNDAGKSPAAKALSELISSARVQANVEVIVSTDAFSQILKKVSSDADCVFMGFNPPKTEGAYAWKMLYSSFINNMPPTILVNSAGSEDMFA